MIGTPELNNIEGRVISREATVVNRRSSRRYPIQMELHWKLIRRAKLVTSGDGRTVDFSSDGIIFDAGCSLPDGLDVNLSIRWPVLLNGELPMKLVVSGRIIRC